MHEDEDADKIFFNPTVQRIQENNEEKQPHNLDVTEQWDNTESLIRSTGKLGQMSGTGKAVSNINSKHI